MKEKQLWMIGAIGAIVAIWLSVLLVSLFSPDLVSGSQQEHLPLAAIVTWISGALATRSVLRIMPRSEGEWMVATPRASRSLRSSPRSGGPSSRACRAAGSGTRRR